MKKGNYLSYQSFQRIDDECGLALFFGKIFKHLNLIRIISAPVVFKDETGKYEEIAVHFHQMCLFELYAHSVISNLRKWNALIETYLTKYMGSWEYYARCKRIDSINEYGGEDDDYNTDDSIKTDVSNERLHHYSIITDLVPDDHQSIFHNTVPEDISHIYTSVLVHGSFTIPEMFKAIGAGHLKTYRQVNGVMVENSPEVEMLDKIDSEAKSEDDAIMLYAIVGVISMIVNEVRNLPKDQDNREFFESLRLRIQKVLDYEILDELRKLQEIHKNK